MTETNDHEPQEPQAAVPPAPEGVMPLSMPPVTTPTPAIRPDATEEVPTVAASGNSVPGGVMPLSMPPMSMSEPPPENPGGGSGGWPPPEWPAAASAWVPPGPSEPAPARHRRTTGVAIVAAAALVAAGVGAGLGVGLSGSSPASDNALSAPTSTAPSTPTTGSGKALSVAMISKLISPAVVNIETNIYTGGQAAGTGMIVSSNGTILTNNHVIEGASSIRVEISGRSQTYPATVLGTSKSQDVALIKVSGLSNLPTVTLANSSNAQIGDTVVAVGNAYGLGGSPSTVAGTIEAVGRTIQASDDSAVSSETLKGLIETNAQIEPGDSGGPLLNSAGQVIGMDTAASSGGVQGGSTIGFAIPINTAKSIALDIEHGTVTTANGVHIGLSPLLGVCNGQDCPSSSLGGSSGGGFSFGGFGNSGTGTCGFNSSLPPHTYMSCNASWRD